MTTKIPPTATVLPTTPAGTIPLVGMTSLVGMTREEMTRFVTDLGEPAFRAGQLFQWIYQKAAQTAAEMTNLPARFRAKLEQSALIAPLTLESRQEDEARGTTKCLLALPDGQKVETVLLRHDYGNSVCVTTQVGCRMGCTFCASTFGGLVRNLTAGEIAGQVLMMQRLLPDEQRVSHVVLMGTGEPLENYDEVLKAIRLMHEPDGLNISYRHFTISTSGVVPGMQALAAEGLPVTLALSLHAPDDDLRTRLMPINRQHGLSEVLAAAREYGEKTGRRVTYEYILIDGVNDNTEQAEQLAALLHGTLAHVNLIPCNPVAERPEYRRPSRNRWERFREILEQHGIAATVRREMGGEIDAACGQLRNRVVRTSRTARS